VGYSLSEGTVFLFCSVVGGEGERSDGLPSGRTPPQQTKKRSRGAAKREEFLRVLWRMGNSAASILDDWWCSSIKNGNPHFPGSPLRFYAPIDRRERAFFNKVPRNLKARTHHAVLTSMTLEGMGPSTMAVEGATTSRVFETYVEQQVLAPPAPCAADRGCGYGQPWSAPAKEGQGAD
jgi:hypothetical protein